MSSAIKNILVTLLSLTFVFAGYYLYTQNKLSTLSASTSDVTPDMAVQAQLFVIRSQALDKIVLDTSIFDNDVFKAQKSFRSPVVEENYGRPNPFNSTTR